MNKAVPTVIASALTIVLLVTLFSGDPDPEEPPDEPVSAMPSPEPDVGQMPDPHGPLSYGMNIHSLDALREANATPDYTTLWIGPWNLEHGWGEPKRHLAEIKEAGIIPAVHFYYWGDDMTRTCFEDGCYSSIHDVEKDQASWHGLADELILNLNATLDGWPMMILLETEFNKANVDGYEPLDAALAGMAKRLGDHFPNATIILPFGNWNQEGWDTWDRAAAQSDHIGIQSMRGSTKHTLDEYVTAYDEIRDGATYARDLFDKPIIIHDVALSTYPEPDYLDPQRMVLEDIFAHLDELKEIGVESLTYRSWHDDPNKPITNYFGVAERHWGLASADGVRKPAADVWIKGVQADRDDA